MLFHDLDSDLDVVISAASTPPMLSESCVHVLLPIFILISNKKTQIPYFYNNNQKYSIFISKKTVFRMLSGISYRSNSK